VEPFEEHLFSRLAEGLLLFERPVLDEVYVLSLYVDFDEGPHRMKVWLYYNTLSHLRRAVGQGEDRDEARWYFALWEPDFITAVGLSSEECSRLTDEECHRMLAEWLQANGLYHSPEAIEAMLADRNPAAYNAWEGQVKERLLHLLPAVARRLQESGVILAKFGRSLPLLVHEWDYDRWTLEATRSANPPGLIAEFERWLKREGCLD
jgi:hypothetical protein